MFKIYSIEDDGFQEKYNLRVGKHINLNFCAADIAWNQTDGKTVSACNKGCIILYEKS